MALPSLKGLMVGIQGDWDPAWIQGWWSAILGPVFPKQTQELDLSPDLSAGRHRDLWHSGSGQWAWMCPKSLANKEASQCQWILQNCATCPLIPTTHTTHRSRRWPSCCLGLCEMTGPHLGVLEKPSGLVNLVWPCVHGSSKAM
jgi:hypothetical protein